MRGGCKVPDRLTQGKEGTRPERTCNHPLLAHHGYAPIYRTDEVNHCPGCGQCQWIIGRITAECAFCATALPLQHTGLEGMGIGPVYWDRDIYRHGWHVGPEHHSLSDEEAEWAL
jgi:hypothetical protein